MLERYRVRGFVEFSAMQNIISQAGEPIGTWGAEWCAVNHDLAPKEVVTASISRCIILRRDREPYPGWIASAYPMNHTAVNV